MATTYLTRTLGTPTDSKKWTVAGWIKKASSGSDTTFVQIGSTNYTRLNFNGNGQLEFDNYDGGFDGRRMTSAFYDDPTAWYHIVAVFDSDNGNADDRMILYVNGSRITAFGTDSDPTSGATSGGNTSGEAFEVGRGAGGQYFNGAMAHVHFCDGYAYAASDFGETDSTSGIWVAKTSPSVSYGTNGVFLKFASGATLTDSSGNGNNMTLGGGTFLHLKDNPDNNFATLNAIQPVSGGFKPQSGATFANGNNVFSTNNSSGNWGVGQSTLSFQKGKWYAECYIQQDTSDDATVGIRSGRPESVADYLGDLAQDYSYYADNGSYYNNNSATSYGDTYATGDYIGIYVDADNQKLYFGKNGTIQNSGTGITISDLTDTDSPFYTMGCSLWSSGTATAIFHWNFGNGIFGTTALGGTTYADAGGEGIFKYDPSVGTFDGSSKDFRALCTNNIATYGG